MVEVTHISGKGGKGMPSALHDVSFKLRNSRIYGLLGPVGAGKTLLLDIMAGVLFPREGQILVNGYDIEKQPLEAKKQIGYLPQKPRLFPDMTPFEFLSFIAEAKGVKGELLSAQVNEALAVTGLTSVQNRLIRILSKSYTQRVGLAQVLIGNPDVILLDEPCAGLDPRQSNEIKELIRRLGQSRTVVVSGHILSELTSLCDHIIVLADGRVVADNVPEALDTSDPLLAQVFADLQKVGTEVISADFEDDTPTEENEDITETVEDEEYDEGETLDGSEDEEV